MELEVLQCLRLPLPDDPVPPSLRLPQLQDLPHSVDEPIVPVRDPLMLQRVCRLVGRRRGNGVGWAEWEGRPNGVGPGRGSGHGHGDVAGNLGVVVVVMVVVVGQRLSGEIGPVPARPDHGFDLLLLTDYALSVMRVVSQDGLQAGGELAGRLLQLNKGVMELSSVIVSPRIQY